jgi:hypothetical protein
MSFATPPSSIGRTLRVAAIAIFATLTISLPAALAQTPIAEGAASHPAHIHSGTCADLGGVVLPLSNLTDLAPTGEVVGADTAVMAVSSWTLVDAPMADILAGEHAINVHLSEDDIDTYIACGDIGGVLTSNEDDGDALIVGLRELNGSGWAGIAWLGQMGDQTEVSVTLIQLDDN